MTTHPTGRVVPYTNRTTYTAGNTTDINIEWTEWRQSYANPFKGSWRRPLWWVDDFGHKHLPHGLIFGLMPHRTLLGWLCDYLDRRLW